MIRRHIFLKMGVCRLLNHRCDWGQRPSVILRGQYSYRDASGRETGKVGFVPSTYLVRFDRAIFNGGGVQ
jgi:hypothetical protein